MYFYSTCIFIDIKAEQCRRISIGASKENNFLRYYPTLSHNNQRGRGMLKKKKAAHIRFMSISA